jgi:hypothetical protein
MSAETEKTAAAPAPAPAPLRCQRIGCDAMFTDDDNPDGSCHYHPNVSSLLPLNRFASSSPSGVDQEFLCPASVVAPRIASPIWPQYLATLRRMLRIRVESGVQGFRCFVSAETMYTNWDSCCVVGVLICPNLRAFLLLETVLRDDLGIHIQLLCC